MYASMVAVVTVTVTDMRWVWLAFTCECSHETIRLSKGKTNEKYAPYSSENNKNVIDLALLMKFTVNSFSSSSSLTSLDWARALVCTFDISFAFPFSRISSIPICTWISRSLLFKRDEHTSPMFKCVPLRFRAFCLPSIFLFWHRHIVCAANTSYTHRSTHTHTMMNRHHKVCLARVYLS